MELPLSVGIVYVSASAKCIRKDGDCQRIIHDHTGKVPNTIRVSLGISSDFGDVWRFMRFVAGFRDRSATEL